MQKIKLCLTILALAALSGCSTMNYPISQECTSEAYLVDNSKKDNEWILTREHEGIATLPGLKEYVQNNYEIDCNKIRKVKLMQDYSKVSQRAMKNWWERWIRLESEAIQKGKSNISETDLKNFKNLLDKHGSSINKTITPVRVSCELPYPTAGGDAYFYRNNRLLFKRPRSQTAGITPDGFRYDGSDVAFNINAFTSGSIDGTTRGICDATR